VANSSDSLDIVDISDPAFPVIVCTVDTRGNTGTVAVVGPYAYVTNYYSGLQIVQLCPSGPLSRIDLGAPTDGAVLNEPPAFAWTYDGGTGNVYAVDVSLSPVFARYYSTYKNLHRVIYDTSWTMPAPVWNMVPSGAQVYWRVRGMDLDSATDPIITSHEAWSFYKQ
jgi:hypothetical protein